MKETLTQSQFVSRFLQIRPDNFTRSALCALFEHLEELERDCGAEMEFDAVSICCDFSEHASAKDWAEDYFAFSANVAAELGLAEGATDEEIEIAAQDYIFDRGTVLTFEHGVVVSSF